MRNEKQVKIEVGSTERTVVSSARMPIANSSPSSAGHVVPACPKGLSFTREDFLAPDFSIDAFLAKVRFYTQYNRVFFPGFPGNQRKWIFRNIELLAKIPWVMGKILEFCVKFLGVLTKIVELWWKFLELWAKNLELWRKIGLEFCKHFLELFENPEKSPAIRSEIIKSKRNWNEGSYKSTK